ncbi:hypothetical protein FACS1894139_05530 [Planctomycetales bacterium]|nr:hypothetical protein FACS1894107_11500 [Planctomycetales bacterium]GHT04037.1 hypothetical protein FACS1894139_05530 [Planctomycetales bacterium]
MCAARKEVDETFPYAKRLREVLVGKTNVELSKLTGVNYASVGMYMSGGMRPSVEFLSALAKNGYDANYILAGVTTAPKAAAPAASAVSVGEISAETINAEIDIFLNIVLKNWGRLNTEVKGQVAGSVAYAAEECDECC